MPSHTTYWKPGDQIVLRFLRNKPGDLIAPVTVVHDDKDYTALYLAVGTAIKGQALRDGTRITRGTPFVEREKLIGGFADFTWSDNHILMLLRKDRMNAIWLKWRDPEWNLVDYYGNIQARPKRTSMGIDTADYLLDVSISKDFECSWKDEDEWALAREHGFIDADLLDEVRREGERIIAEVGARAWPFDGSMIDWRPDPAWPIPTLPGDWDLGLQYPESVPE